MTTGIGVSATSHVFAVNIKYYTERVLKNQYFFYNFLFFFKAIIVHFFSIISFFIKRFHKVIQTSCKILAIKSKNKDFSNQKVYKNPLVSQIYLVTD